MRYFLIFICLFSFANAYNINSLPNIKPLFRFKGYEYTIDVSDRYFVLIETEYYTNYKLTINF